MAAYCVAGKYFSFNLFTFFFFPSYILSLMIERQILKTQSALLKLSPHLDDGQETYLFIEVRVAKFKRPRVLGDQKISEDNQELRPGCPPDYQILL